MIYYLSAYTHFNLIHLWIKKWARENDLLLEVIAEIPGQLWQISCSEEQMDALNQVLQTEVPEAHFEIYDDGLALIYTSESWAA